ncbi:hypothetical protein [Aureispira sp. CCB-QB1]|uniref:hypothetical protein n=1 Tax=Aureispira sp. CCB-QB1 TaxID=1313421 RepID=UPI00069865A1|nr:hypothetical protein [Aureispira sp. CCB-QB1]
MGVFISMTCAFGKSEDEVTKCLNEFFQLENENIGLTDIEVCTRNTSEENYKVTILYPSGFYKWDNASKYISEKLKIPVFSFHIHDGDLWMYLFFEKGQLIDKFNPLPDYWDKISSEERKTWEGKPQIIADKITGVEAFQIKKYLTNWDYDSALRKAYPQDEFENEAWQVIDFMDKLGFVYPSNDGIL